MSGRCWVNRSHVSTASPLARPLSAVSTLSGATALQNFHDSLDRDEALARFFKMARLESLVAGLVILVIVVLALGRKRREEARALRERIERQQDILNLERYAQDVVDSLPAWLLVLSSDLRILSANRPFLDYFHLDLEEIVGLPLHDVLRAESLPHRADQVTHAKTTTRDVLLEVVIKGREERRPVRFTMADLVRVDQGDRRMLLVIEDLTESERLRVAAHAFEQRLRESERRFRLLAENAPGVSYLCRNDARYTMEFISAGVEELTGFSRNDFLENKVSFTELYHPADVAAIQQEVSEAVSERRPFHLSYRLRHHSGAWRWVDEIGVAIYESNELAYWQGILTDITERKLTEAANGQRNR